MTDALAWRKIFAVIGPSTNTVVQPDMEGMRPAGVTNQYRDIYVEDPVALSNADFEAGTGQIANGLKDCFRTALTCKPDYLVMGVSAISFVGGLQGATQFVKDVEEFTKLKVSVGSIAVADALKAYGGIKRIAFISPYHDLDHAFHILYPLSHCPRCPLKHDIPVCFRQIRL